MRDKRVGVLLLYRLVDVVQLRIQQIETVTEELIGSLSERDRMLLGIRRRQLQVAARPRATSTRIGLGSFRHGMSPPNVTMSRQLSTAMLTSVAMRKRPLMAV